MSIMTSIAYAGQLELYGGFISSLTYDQDGNATYPAHNLGIYGFALRLQLVSGDLPISPHVDALAQFKYLTADSLAGRVLNLMLQTEAPFITTRLGFNLDFSPSSSSFFDGNNAILLSIATRFPITNLSLHYIYPMDGINQQLIVKPDLGFRVGIGELAYARFGLQGIYRRYLSQPSSYNFSILPYAGLKLTNIMLELLMGAEDEYDFYGIGLSGRSAPATGFGMQLRLKYYF